MNYLAQNLDSIQSSAFSNNSIPTSVGALITKTLPYVFGAAAISLLVYLVMGGFGLMTSQGDPKAMQSAQGKISSALIGFVIVVVSFVLVKLIGQLLGIDAFRPIFGF